jgi:hypothetical protein
VPKKRFRVRPIPTHIKTALIINGNGAPVIGAAQQLHRRNNIPERIIVGYVHGVVKKGAAGFNQRITAKMHSITGAVKRLAHTAIRPKLRILVQ